MICAHGKSAPTSSVPLSRDCEEGFQVSCSEGGEGGGKGFQGCEGVVALEFNTVEDAAG